MVALFKGVRSFPAFLCALAAFMGCWALKISPIIGSYCSFFSVADVLTPLAGCVGLTSIIALGFTRVSLTVWALQAPFKALVYHIPGLSASLGWAYPNVFLRVVLPILCMVAFCLHPIGSQAVPYALYWLIPVIIYFSGKKTVFLHALATTFIAHGVGSVVWLYVKALPVAVWWTLIPVVAVERLSYACIMTAVYYAADLVMHGRKSFVAQQFAFEKIL